MPRAARVCAHDLEGCAAQVAVHRQPVGVGGEVEAVQVYLLAPDAVLPLFEPVAPRVHERDRGHAAGAELVERAGPRDVLVAAMAQ